MATPSHEPLSNSPPILRCIDGFFSEAYGKQLEGDSPLEMVEDLGGQVEIIGLNPKKQPGQGDNVRFILWGGGLYFKGFVFSTFGSEEEIAIKHKILKITLTPEDNRPIASLDPADLNLLTMFIVSEGGRVFTSIDELREEETEKLVGSLQGCLIAPEVPNWAKEG